MPALNSPASSIIIVRGSARAIVKVIDRATTGGCPYGNYSIFRKKSSDIDLNAGLTICFDIR